MTADESNCPSADPQRDTFDWLATELKWGGQINFEAISFWICKDFQSSIINYVSNYGFKLLFDTYLNLSVIFDENR